MKCFQISTGVYYPVHDADVVRSDGSTHCCRCGETTGPALPYRVDEYEADGHQSPPEQLHHSMHRTLAEARAEVRRLLGVSSLRRSRKWSGGGNVEAYHMFTASQPNAYGCGGYSISMYREER